MTAMPPRYLLDRLGRCRRRNGLLALPRQAVLKAWRHIFRNRHCVYIRDMESVSTLSCPDLTIEKFLSERELPQKYFKQLTVEEGRCFADVMHQEFANDGVLWLGFVSGQVAAYQWSRQGGHIKNWFVSLNAEDVVIFSTVTFPPHRGRGISPSMMRHIAHQGMDDDGRVFVDCKVWNVAAVRGIEKAGFRRIGIMPPLKHG